MCHRARTAGRSPVAATRRCRGRRRRPSVPHHLRRRRPGMSSPRCPPGVWVRALASRLTSTCCSRAPSPVTTTGSSGRSSDHSWSGPATCASATASTASCDRSTGSRLQRPSSVQPGQQQQVLDEMRHPDGLGFDAAHRVCDLVGQLVPLALREFGIAADRRQRSAKFVAGVGDELPHAHFAGVAGGQRVGDPFEHAVQRRRRAGPPRCARRLGPPRQSMSAASPRRGRARGSATSRAAADTRDSGASWRRMITMPSAIATASAMPATMPKIATTDSIVDVDSRHRQPGNDGVDAAAGRAVRSRDSGRGRRGRWSPGGRWG